MLRDDGDVDLRLNSSLRVINVLLGFKEDSTGADRYYTYYKGCFLSAEDAVEGNDVIGRVIAVF